jgi:hypothetical protein
MIGALTLPPTGIYTSPGVSGIYATNSVFSVPSLTSNNSWTYAGVTTFASQFVGRTARLYFRYRNGNSGSSFQGDFAIDYIRLPNNILYSGSSIQSFRDFQYSTINTSLISTAASSTWYSIGATTSTTGGRWNQNAGGTPSSNTGPSAAYSGNYYLYAETSSPTAFNQFMWLRSPSITISRNDYLFHYHAYGACVGRIEVYVVLED